MEFQDRGSYTDKDMKTVKWPKHVYCDKERNTVNIKKYSQTQIERRWQLIYLRRKGTIIYKNVLLILYSRSLQTNNFASKVDITENGSRNERRPL